MKKLTIGLLSIAALFIITSNLQSKEAKKVKAKQETIKICQDETLKRKNFIQKCRVLTTNPGNRLSMMSMYRQSVRFCGCLYNNFNFSEYSSASCEYDHVGYKIMIFIMKNANAEEVCGHIRPK